MMKVPIETKKQKNCLSIIWIDKNIYNEENKFYLNKLGYHRNNTNSQNNFNYDDSSSSENSFNTLNTNKKYNPFLHPFDIIEEAIDYIKLKRFAPTIVIVSGSCFVDFVKTFHKNINDIYVIPKIIIFTSTSKKFILPDEISNEENLDIFYQCGGIQTSFNKIKKFIEKKQKEILNYPSQNKFVPKT